MTLRLPLQVFAWGLNTSGQLGLNDVLVRKSPAVVDALWAMPVHQLAAGQSSTLPQRLTASRPAILATIHPALLLPAKPSLRHTQSLVQGSSVELSCVCILNHLPVCRLHMRSALYAHCNEDG